MEAAIPGESRGGGDSRIARSRGCSWRESVADVGETHLPRQAKRTFGFVAKARVSLTRRFPDDDGGRFAVGERVRGERGRTSKGTRASLLRSRGRRSIQQKVSWFRACMALTPPCQRPGSGRAGSPRDSRHARTPERRAMPSVEHSTEHPTCDRGRQKSGRPVRLPQPIGAGGQQPLRSHRPWTGVTGCCAGCTGGSYHGEYPCYPIGCAL